MDPQLNTYVRRVEDEWMILTWSHEALEGGLKIERCGVESDVRVTGLRRGEMGRDVWKFGVIKVCIGRASVWHCCSVYEDW
ncbi:hypothetical protein CTI12_AA455610 [Artemisia annua]|uniref:Uncharacterized protein n=1 Tax=Artemisia annua TaxID=35608 RepID=A0A2U1LU46_ARTAN|nr:hypothetical protein CTI12_AA455610 [Artemisia annua]